MIDKKAALERITAIRRTIPSGSIYGQSPDFLWLCGLLETMLNNTLDDARQVIKEAVAAERERCAEIADNDLHGVRGVIVRAEERLDGGASAAATIRIAAAIRRAQE